MDFALSNKRLACALMPKLRRAEAFCDDAQLGEALGLKDADHAGVLAVIVPHADPPKIDYPQTVINWHDPGNP